MDWKMLKEVTRLDLRQVLKFPGSLMETLFAPPYHLPGNTWGISRLTRLGRLRNSVLSSIDTNSFLISIFFNLTTHAYRDM